MHPELIKAHIRMNGTTPSAIADDLGVTRAAVWNVIYAESKSARIRSVIVKVTGMAEEKLWPPQAPSGLRRAKAPSKRLPPGLRRQLPKAGRDAYGFPVGAKVFGEGGRLLTKKGLS